MNNDNNEDGITAEDEVVSDVNASIISHNTNLTMKQITGVVYLFIFGAAISMLMLVCERIYKAMKIMFCFL